MTAQNADIAGNPAGTGGCIKVVVADDERGARVLVRKVLESCPDVTIVAEAKDGRQAVAASKMFRPDVIVMDYDMPVMNGIEAATEIFKRLPKTKILIYSASGDEAEIDRARAAGVSGWIAKYDAKKLTEAIQSVRKE